MNKLNKIIAGIALCALSSAASAVSIQGDIAFGVNPGASWAPTGGTGIADATGIDFIPAVDGFAGQVTSTGLLDYTGTIGTKTTFSDFTFAPLTNPSSLWSFAVGAVNYSFDMTSVTIDLQVHDAITLSGNGLANITGFDETSGSWALSFDSTGTVFSFSSTASVVPEPALVLLLSTGLIGFGVARKLRKKA